MQARWSRSRLAASIALGGALLACRPEPDLPPPPVESEPLAAGPKQEAAADDPAYSTHLEATLVVPEGVFPPAEADHLFLPFMKEHADLFPGKHVLDIGSGSGIIAIYAARLGAASVVATDIDPAAIEAIGENARRFGVDAVVNARLVPAEDTSAYSVVEPGEVFDVILGNPPYSLDLDAAGNTPLVDTGDLGFSILRDLEQHLAADGVTVLLYNSLFYHRLMVELARHLGYDVRHHDAYGLTSWELEALFNGALSRVLAREGLPPDAFEFDAGELPMLRSVGTESAAPEPLIAGKSGGALYRGLVVIRWAPPWTPPDAKPTDAEAGRQNSGR